MNSLRKFSGRRILAILIKEFIQLLRDRTTLGMIVGIPIIQLLLFGFAINSDPKHLPTAVLSPDHSIFARDVVSGLKNSDYFEITREPDSVEEAKELLQQGKVIFVVSIPDGFSRQLIHGDSPSLLIEADGTDPIAVGGAIAAVDGALRQSFERDLNGVLNSTPPPTPSYTVNIQRLYNPEGFSRFNIVPGLIAVVLTMTGVMMTALSLTRERERGTMENLLSMPVRPIEVMIGKIAPYVLIGYVQATIIILTAHFLFGVPIFGNLLLLAFGLLIFIVCNMALGFTLSAKATNQMQAMQMSTFLLLPSILLSGFMFPFLGMPRWAQMLGSLLPSTYFIRIVRGIMLKGSTFLEIWPNVWPLLCFMVVITFIATRVYRKTLD